jgi:hypothetical protein
MFPDEVTIVRRRGGWRSYLCLNTGPKVTVLIARSIGTEGNRPRWQIDPVAHERQYVTLIALVDSKNEAVHEMYMFANVNRDRRLYVTTDHAWLKSGKRLDSLSQLLEIVEVVLQGR